MTREDHPKAKSAGTGQGGRRTARLAAVQALYQVDLAGDAAETVIRQFVDHRLDAGQGGKGGRPDSALFAELVRGVIRRRQELDEMLASALTLGREVERLELVLRVILEAGAYELIARGDVPAGVVITEYTDIAAGFFESREVSIVNAVLDRLARLVRSGDEGGPSGDGQAAAG